MTNRAGWERTNDFPVVQHGLFVIGAGLLKWLSRNGQPATQKIEVAPGQS